MKKNKMMRIASLLLVAVLLSTSIISGTFAKYVTSDSVSDKARVAKFGVVVTADGTLFDTTYVTTTNVPGKSEGTAPDYDDNAPNALSVESFDGDKLVAPGTKNEEGITISVTGKPEVDVKVDIEFDANDEDVFLAAKNDLPDMTTGNATDKFNNNAAYYPIVYTLKKDGTVVKTGNLADIEKYITDSYAGYYDANTDLAEKIGVLKLTWAWDFDDNGAGTFDKQDTLLGDLAAGTTLTPATTLVDGTDYNLDVQFDISISVTQVD